MREQDFVSRAKLPADGAADRKCQRSHIGTEDDFVRIAAEKVSHRGTGAGDYLVGVAAGGVSPAGVRVIAAQVVGNRVNHPLRDLRSARPIEECSGMAVDALRKGRELGAHPIEI